MAIGTPVQLGNANGTGANIVITTTAAAASGDAIFVFAGCNNGSFSPSTCADSAGNTYTATTLQVSGSSKGRLFYCLNSAGLASGGTITITPTGGSGFVQVANAISVSGIATTSAKDVEGAGLNGTGTTPSISTGTLAQADELVCGFLFVALGRSDSFTESSGFTSNNPNTAQTSVIRSAYKVAASTSSVTYAPTLGTSRTYAGNVITFKAASNTAYTLTAAQGSLSLSGQAATLKRGYPLTASQGSFTLSGQSAAFLRTLKLTAAQGSLTLSGQAAGLYRKYPLTASQGAFALTGQTATLLRGLKLTAAHGSISLSGQNATLLKGRTVAAAQGSFALSGQTASLKAARKLTSAQGAFSLTGQAAGLFRAYALIAAQGSFALSGQDATPLAARRISLEAGAITLAGQDAALVYAPLNDYALTASFGAIVLAGQAATLTYRQAGITALPIRGRTVTAGPVAGEGGIIAYPIRGTTMEAS